MNRRFPESFLDVAGRMWPLRDGDPPGKDVSRPSGTVVAVTPLDGEPHGLAIDPAGNLLVAQELAGTVTRFALPETTPVTTVSWTRGRVGTASASGEVVTTGPGHVAIDPAGTTAYLLGRPGNAVSVLSLASNTITASIPLTKPGCDIIVAPDGRHVYASTADGRLWVIDACTNAVVDSMAAGSAACGFAFSPDGGILYASSRDTSTVTAFRTTDHARLATFQVGGRPRRLAVSPGGAFLYAANQDAGLTVVSVCDGQILAAVNPLGSGYGLGMTPDGAQLYLTEPRSGRLAIIERLSLRTRDILTLGGAPRNVAFSADGTFGVVTDGDGRVIFIR